MEKSEKLLGEGTEFGLTPKPNIIQTLEKTSTFLLKQELKFEKCSSEMDSKFTIYEQDSRSFNSESRSNKGRKLFKSIEKRAGCNCGENRTLKIEVNSLLSEADGTISKHPFLLLQIVLFYQYCNSVV